MWGIHSLGQPQSPLFIRFYMHLRHMFVLVPKTVGFLTSNMKGNGPTPYYTSLSDLHPTTYQTFPSYHSFSQSLCSWHFSPPCLCSHPLFCQTCPPNSACWNCRVSRSFKIFSNFSTPMRPFHIHLIWQSSATQVISYFHHRVFC